MNVERKRIKCSKCGKEISSTNITKHQKSNKCRNYKTNPTGSIMPVTSPQDVVNPEAGLESKSSKLININLKGEYDKMTETLNPKKTKNDGKEKKYECGACGCQFNNLNDGKCPDCGVQLT